jgi:hypothetical protein
MPTEAPLRELSLHAHIRRLIDEGRLPVVLPGKSRAGAGSGSKCDACDQPVTATQIEYDVRQPGDSSSQLSLHLECYVLWQIECVRRIKKRSRQDSRLYGSVKAEHQSQTKRLH